MNSKEVIAFFGGPAATGKALGISSQAVSQWGELVPSTRLKTVELAMQVEKIKRSRAKATKKKVAQQSTGSTSEE